MCFALSLAQRLTLFSSSLSTVDGTGKMSFAFSPQGSSPIHTKTTPSLTASGYTRSRAARGGAPPSGSWLRFHRWAHSSGGRFLHRGITFFFAFCAMTVVTAKIHHADVNFVQTFRGKDILLLMYT